MNLKSAEKQIDKLLMLKKSHQSGRYSCKHDENGSLLIQFQDGEKYKIPVFDLRPYQAKAQRKMILEKYLRHFWMWTRRGGKEVTSWNLIIEKAIEVPGIYDIIYPTNVRAKDVIWDGSIILKDGSILKFLDMIPARFILKIDNQTMKIHLVNGSMIHVYGIDTNPDKPRGTNPRGIVLAEAAWLDPRVLSVILPILRQNKGWLILQSTYNGKNHFYELGNKAQNDEKWYFSFETCETMVDKDGNRFISDESLEEDRKFMPPDMFNQEYLGIVNDNQESKYFSKELAHLQQNEKIIQGLYIHDSPVWVCFDIGVNDSTVMIYVQLDRNNNPVIIGCVEESNRNFLYFIEEAKKFCVQRGLVFASIFLPHDGNNRSWTSSNDKGDKYTPKSAVNMATELGYECHAVGRPASHITAINLMRLMLYRTTFNEENTPRLRECLAEYGKEFDVKMSRYKDHPVHNWSSHCVKAFQTMTLAIEEGLLQNVSYEITYTDN